MNNPLPPLDSFMTRHLGAMMDPRSDEERTLVNLLAELARLCDRYPKDRVMMPIVEGLATVIIRLAGDGVLEPGRIDGPTIQRQVRDMVRRAGGDPNV
jgi:hypothetical protein